MTSRSTTHQLLKFPVEELCTGASSQNVPPPKGGVINWKSQSQMSIPPYELLVREAQEAPNILSIVGALGCPPGRGHKNLMAEDTTHLGCKASRTKAQSKLACSALLASFCCARGCQLGSWKWRMPLFWSSYASSVMFLHLQWLATRHFDYGILNELCMQSKDSFSRMSGLSHSALLASHLFPLWVIWYLQKAPQSEFFPAGKTASYH